MSRLDIKVKEPRTKEPAICRDVRDEMLSEQEEPPREEDHSKEAKREGANDLLGCRDGLRVCPAVVVYLEVDEMNQQRLRKHRITNVHAACPALSDWEPVSALHGA